MSQYGPYVPSFILHGINDDDYSNNSQIEAGYVKKIFSVIMFLDISGFTPLTEKYDYLICNVLHCNKTFVYVALILF
jgi:hypothetical protein